MKEETAQLLILTGVLLIYMLIGAAIFSALEIENERQLRLSYHELFEKFARSNNVSETLMSKFKAAHQDACLLGLMDDDNQRWNYAGSFYFTGTVITTIGFGLTAPSTYGGQLFFLFYGILGIPLNILFLNTALERIVTALVVMLRSFSKLVPKNKFLKPIGPREFPTGYVLFTMMWILILTTLLLASIFSFLEKWDMFEAIYFIFVACSTVGFGDYVPSKSKTRVGHNRHPGYIVGNWFLIGFGVVVTYVALNLIANYMKQGLKYIMMKSERYLCPCVSNSLDTIEAKEGKIDEQVPRANSTISIASDASAIDVGSFGAIQRALDKMKRKAELSQNAESNEIKALSTIEVLLRNEFKKARERQGNSVRAKWKKAAAKARRYHRQRQLCSQQQSAKTNLESVCQINLGVTNPVFDDSSFMEPGNRELQLVSINPFIEKPGDGQNNIMKPSKVYPLSEGGRAKKLDTDIEITEL